jgi:hypothetical protein
MSDNQETTFLSSELITELVDLANNCQVRECKDLPLSNLTKTLLDASPIDFDEETLISFIKTTETSVNIDETFVPASAQSSQNSQSLSEVVQSVDALSAKIHFHILQLQSLTQALIQVNDLFDSLISKVNVLVDLESDQ